MGRGRNMIIYPSIDILDGKCVRLEQGRYDRVTVYADNPVDYVDIWTSKGARYIHVVDLNGARTGNPDNDNIIKAIVKKADVPVQTGGGIRSMERVDTLLSMGVSRVILGTGAIQNPKLVIDAVKRYGGRIIIGIDAKDGYAAVDGWEKKSDCKAVEFAVDMESIGVETIIYTDIARDGMLSGPNIEAMKTMAETVGCDVIASGGVSCLGDIMALAKTGVKGIIVGKALYENKLDFFQAQKLLDDIG